MRICRISRSYPPAIGGLERHVELLSRYQARLGYDVHVLQPVASGNLESGMELHRVSIGPIVRWIYRGPFLSKIGTLLFAIRAAIAASSLHRNKGIDLVHIHGDVGEVLIFKLIGPRVPTFLTMHSRPNQRRFYNILARWILPRLAGIIFGADFPGGVRRLDLTRDRIAVISSGVEYAEFQNPSHVRAETRAKLNIPQDVFVIISVGRLVSMKGFDTLLEACKLLLEERPQMLTLIVGDGPARVALEKKARSIPKVHFLGAMDHSSVVRLLCAADVFIILSHETTGMAEGTPTAILEAMAAGLPIIAAATGGIRGLVVDNTNGILVPPGDPDAIARAVTRLVSDPALRRAMGEENLKQAAARDWVLLAERVVAFYAACLNKKVSAQDLSQQDIAQ